MKKQIAANIASNYLSRAVALALGVFLVPFLIGKLGVEVFGIVVLTESLTRFIDLVSSSIRAALARHATFALAQDNMEEFTEYLSTGRIILFAAAVVVFCIGAGFSFLVPAIFKIPAEHMAGSRNLFLLFTVAFTITFPNMVFWSSLYAKQRYDLLNAAAAAGLILRALLVFLLFSILPARFVNLTTYGFIYLAVIWMDNFLVCFWSRRLFPNIRLKFSRFSAEKAKQIFFFGVFTTISSSSNVFYDNLIQVLINLLWGPRYNAIYGIAAKFPSAMHRLFVEPTWTLTPTFTDLVARGEQAKIKLLYFMYAKAVAIVSLPVVLVFVVLSKPIIALWVGPDFSEAAVMMSILMAPLIVSMPLAVAGCVHIAYAKVKVPSFVITASVVFQFALSVALAGFFSMGIVGISVAEAFMSLTIGGFFSAYYSCRVSGLSLKEFWTQAYLPPFLWACSMTGTGILAYRALYGNVLTMNPVVALLIIFWTVLYVAGVYKLTLNPEEKGQIRSLPGLIFSRLNPSAGI